MLEESLLPKAVEMAQRGSTHGMIVQMLRSHDLSDEAARRVIDRAFQITKRRHRARGFVQLVFGSGLAVAGLMGMYWVQQQGWENAPTVICALGLIIASYGLISIVRNRQ